MLSTVLLITIAAMFLCVGFMIGGIYSTIFSLVSAIIATVALIITIIRRRKNNERNN